jgi:DNA topoisomerase-1
MSKPLLRRCSTSTSTSSTSTSLCYADYTIPGIKRKRIGGKYFVYFDKTGKRITDKAEITRLNKIGLPPAYNDAWLCPSPLGHIQAIGYDEKGRKQYRYHTKFRAAQEADKYNLCADFGRSLPLIRASVESDLSLAGAGKDTVIAAIVRLLDLGKVRIGNKDYEKTNNSFGATTLHTRHAKAIGTRLSLEYRGKSGKMQKMTIDDSDLVRIVRRCQDLPGQHLFQYLDNDTDQVHSVTSNDVNDYIRKASGKDFTAKHFRTWGANTIAFEALINGCSTLKDMIEPVSKTLGNTPAIARKSYVHPALIEFAQTEGVKFKLKLPNTKTKYLSRVECGLIDFLEKKDAGDLNIKNS